MTTDARNFLGAAECAYCGEAPGPMLPDAGRWPACPARSDDGPCRTEAQHRARIGSTLPDVDWQPETSRYTLMAGGADGGWPRHQWTTTEYGARLYASRYALPGDLLTGPHGETVHRY